MNVWLDGEPVDPFPRAGDASLWRAGPEPLPGGGDEGEVWEASEYDPDGVRAAIRACRTQAVRERLAALQPGVIQCGHVVAEMNYYPTRFESRPAVYARTHPRAPRLDLPLRAADFDGVCFADDLG